jgi:hypothetical protein
MQLPLRGVNSRALLRFLPFPRLGDKATRKKEGEQVQDEGPAIASRFIVPLGLAISCIAHLVFLGPAFMLAGGSPFNTPPADAITVDIVTPEELSQAADNQAQAETAPRENASAPASPPPAASTPPAVPGLGAAASAPPRSPDQPTGQQARATQQSVLPPPPFALQTAQPEFPQPAAPNDPGGMFGMPMTMPDGTVGGGRFDSQAVDRADVANDVVAAFRTQLKTCSKLPPGVAPDVRVVIRLYLMPDGSLATGLPENPKLIKVDGASVGGGVLWNSAAAALSRCQPYKMMPPDRYEEWKMLDITFTPQNF